MARLPHAATTLVRQVTALKPRTKVTRVSDPDGLGVVRSIRFNKQTSNWLAPLLHEIADRRISGLEAGDEGLVVTFVATTKADSRDPYPLAEAAEVLSSRPPT